MRDLTPDPERRGGGPRCTASYTETTRAGTDAGTINLLIRFDDRIPVAVVTIDSLIEMWEQR